ncbi:hypothetical protein GW17_00014069, partial [Ensete ventricosum]
MRGSRWAPPTGMAEAIWPQLAVPTPRVHGPHREPGHDCPGAWRGMNGARLWWGIRCGRVFS